MGSLAFFQGSARSSRHLWVIGLHETACTGILLSPDPKQAPILRRSSDVDNPGDLASALAGFLSCGARDLAETSREEGRKSDRKMGTAPRSPVDVGIILSSRLCRYLAVPWSDAFLQKDEAAAYLRTEFLGVYGDPANDWEIIAQDADYDRPRAACAVEASLLRNLRESYAAMAVKPVFCRPSLSVAFDHFSPRMNAEKGIFALVEKDALSFMAWAGDDILDIDIERCAEKDRGNALTGWYERHRLTEGDGFRMFVLCPPDFAHREIADDEKCEWVFLGESEDGRGDRILLPDSHGHYRMPTDALWD